MPRWCASAKRGQRLAHDVDDAPEGQRPFFVGDAREVPPAQKLHHQVELAVVRLAEVDDAHRVRMVEAARRARFGDEPSRRALVAEQVRMDDLDGDGAPQHALLGPIHAPHAADADQVQDHVPARKRAVDERIFGRRRAGDLRDGKTAERAKLMRFVATVSALRTGTVHRHDQISMRERRARRKVAAARAREPERSSRPDAPPTNR